MFIQRLMQLIWQICLLRAGPQDMPYSLILLVSFFICTLLVNLLQINLTGAGHDALAQVGIVLLSTTLFTYFVLSIRQLAERYVQTLSSLLAVSVLINLCILPLVFAAPIIFGPDVSDTLRFIATFVYLFVLFFTNLWLVLVTAHIFCRALDVSFMAGVLVTLGLYGMNVLIYSQFN